MAKQPTLFSFFSKTSSPQPNKLPPKSKSENDFKSLDLAWAKLDGYPWWPALIYEHPTDKTFVRKNLVHVQFFDDPPTRSWVKETFVKPYGSPSSCGLPTYKDPLWLKAKEAADAIISVPNVDRAHLIVEMVFSDAEDSNGDLDDSDKSKENLDVNVNKGKKKLSNGDDNEEQPKKKRRIVLISDSEESADEYKPDKEKEDSDDDDDSVSSGVDEMEVSDHGGETESDGTPIKEVKKRKPPSKLQNSKFKRNISFSPMNTSSRSDVNNSSLLDSTKSKLALFSAKETPSKRPSVNDEEDWPHTKITWLKPDKIKDKEGRRPNHPDYNPRTLFVPEDFLNKQTPGMRQWWELKSQHFDTVLFFKMGKFYELFHMDAILSIQELGLLMMKGDNAHTGFPEIAYGRYSATLIEKGYKVGRIEQTETPEMMEKRCKQLCRPSKFDKVVNRELCQVTSLGTRIPSVMDGDVTDTSSSFLLAITERLHDGPGDLCKIGVAFIDTSIGTFHIGQFIDDRHHSRLRTLVAHYPPAQILVERGRLSSKSLQLVKSIVPVGLIENLAPEKEFWNASRTLSFLSESDFFRNGSEVQLPQPLKNVLNEGDLLGITAKEDFELGVSSLGGLIWYLQLCRLEEDLLTRKKFAIYFPPDTANKPHAIEKEIPNYFKKHMVVDGNSLYNLEVFQNSSNGSSEGTLFETLNNCCTPFGKRLLHSWLCAPLCNKSAIDNRLDAIEDLRENQEIISIIKPFLKSLPDLEKLLSKIHSQGLKHSPNHPDTRAIFFESKQYSQRKVIDFLSAVEGFKTTLSIVRSFKGMEGKMKSSLLKSLVTLEEKNGKFPSLNIILKFFDNAFDHSLAKKEGKIIPSQGVDTEYDEAVKFIEETQRKLDSYLKEQCRVFAAKVTYWGNDKKRFQLEIPDHATKRVANDYELVSQKKGYKRYWTKTTKDLLNDITAAEEQRESSLQDIARKIFSQFDEHFKEWASAVECMSVLDVILSLTHFSLQVESTRPIVESPSPDVTPFIDIQEGRHPCAIKIFSGGDYIPNDIIMGCKDIGMDSHSQLVLVTGPNMGGKSTLMRQTALLCLMAQLGSFVPAFKCHLSAVDRIFTRLGAWDRIYQGESTFYVELAETASIMQHATPHSLVIVDELGRGTATYDGTAIAYSVIKVLNKINCRTLFSTHYHSLVDDFRDTKGISLGHMACMVEGENEEDPSQETITFLYKFVEGACPKSYGFNAARLAELPESVICSASRKALELEKCNMKKNSFRTLFGHLSSKEMVKDVISKINIYRKV